MWVTVLQTKVQVGVIFSKKYFYRYLSAINSNVDFIMIFEVKSIQIACTLVCIAYKKGYQYKSMHLFLKGSEISRKVVAKTWKRLWWKRCEIKRDSQGLCRNAVDHINNFGNDDPGCKTFLNQKTLAKACAGMLLITLKFW